MEVNVSVKVIDGAYEIAVEQPLRSLIHEQQLSWRRQSAGNRFAQHALRGDGRRAGKTAKLIDLCARLKCSAV
jgi:hypothetical protein